MPALKELGGCGHDEGKLAEAAQALEQAVALGPSDGNAFADLGNVYLRQDRVDDAEKALQRALALDPTLPLANNTMGLAALRKGIGGAAETHFREAIRLQPDLAEAHNNLGNLLAGRQGLRRSGSSLRKGDRAAIHVMWKRATAMAWFSPWRVRISRAVAELEAVVVLAPRLATRASISPTCWRRWGVRTRLARILRWPRRAAMRRSARPRSPACAALERSRLHSVPHQSP